MWPTPTPIPPSAATPPIDLGGAEYEIAEWIVQGYQQANQHGLLDMIFLAALALLVIGGVYLIMQRVRTL
jgi:hypothetical protein